MIAGLGFLAIAIGSAFLLITDVLFDGARVWIYSVARLGRRSWRCGSAARSPPRARVTCVPIGR